MTQAGSSGQNLWRVHMKKLLLLGGAATALTFAVYTANISSSSAG